MIYLKGVHSKMGKKLRTYNDQELNAFRKLFESNEYKSNRIYESIGDKFYRHEYCLVGNEMVEEVLSWFKKCGLTIQVVRVEKYQTEIELI